MTGKAKQEARGPEETRSTIEQHHAWPRVLTFLEVQPGDNNALQKCLRDVARAEAELREAGSGPELGQQLRAATFAAVEAGREVARYRAAGIAPPPELVQKCDSTEDAEAEAAEALRKRKEKTFALAEEVRQAHLQAVAALHDAFRRRFQRLAHEAVRLVETSPAAGKRHPERLTDDLLVLERQLKHGADLAGLFPACGTVATAGGGDFWGSLDPETADLIAAKWKSGYRASGMGA